MIAVLGSCYFNAADQDMSRTFVQLIAVKFTLHREKVVHLYSVVMIVFCESCAIKLGLRTVIPCCNNTEERRRII